MANKILVTGNTYPVKDQLRAMGGTWDPKAKGWRVPAARAADAQALVASAPKSTPRATRYPTRFGRSGECSCKYCRSGNECLCIHG